MQVILSDIYLPFHPLERELRKLAQESEKPIDVEFCIDVVYEALKKACHVVKARSISMAAGFCTYAARLVESVGVKDSYISLLPGKGVLVHKALALSAPLIFNDYLKRNHVPGLNELKEVVQYAIETIKCIEPYVHNLDEKDVINTTTSLLNVFINEISIASSKLSLELGKCYALAEHYMIDFDLHIAGTPDLIIECLKSRPRSIVIEWKTYGTTPHEWEKVQVYTYALLEARRLGYGTRKGVRTKVDFEGLFNAIATDDPKDVAVVPVIIRTNGSYSNHPAYPVAAHHVLSVEELKELLTKIVVAAAHLTLLRTDYVMLAGCSEEEFNKRCKIKIKDYEGHLVRWTPRTLNFHGTPSNRDKSWVCNVCKKLHPLIYDACPLFFGKGPEKDVIDVILWKYRYRIYSIHERALAPLKALHDIDIEILKEAINTGQTIEYDVDQRKYRLLRSDKKPRPVLKCITTSIAKKRQVTLESRIDFFDEVKIPKGISFLSEHGYTLSVKLRRKIRSFEKEWLIETGREDTIPRIWSPRLGKPVLVVFYGDQTLKASSPAFSVSIFGRVADVEIDLNDFEHIEMVIEPISNAFRFQYLILINYAKYYDTLMQGALAIELNVDLTHMELQALYTIQRLIRQKINELGISGDEIRDLRRVIRENTRDLLMLLAGAITMGGAK